MDFADDFNGEFGTASRFLVKARDQNRQGESRENDREIIEHTSEIKKGLYNENLLKSLKFVTRNLQKISNEEVFELSNHVLRLALNFQQRDFSCAAIHLLAMITINPEFQPLKAEFVNQANVNDLLAMSIGPFDPIVVNMLTSFIAFSDETFAVASESGLLSKIIKERPFFPEDEVQTIHHLHLLFSLIQKYNDNNQIRAAIYKRATMAASLSMKKLYPFCIQIFRSFFKMENDAAMFIEYFQNYSPIFFENIFDFDDNFSLNFLIIVYTFSNKLILWPELQCDFPLYEYMHKFIVYSDGQKDNDEISKYFWQTLQNFIEFDESMAITTIDDSTIQLAMKIVEEGSIANRGYACLYLASLFTKTNNDLIFQAVVSMNILETVLMLVDYVDIQFSEYIIEQTYQMLLETHLPDIKRDELIEQLDSNIVFDCLTNFLDNYNDKNDDIWDKAATIHEIIGEI